MKNRIITPTRPTTLTILYHFDPWGAGVGGIDSMIRNWVRFAPEAVRLRIAGASADVGRQLKWYDCVFEGRDIRFMSLFPLSDPTTRSLVPHTLRFAVGLARAGRQLDSDFVHFHRVEPATAAIGWRGRRTLFFHADMEKVLTVPVAENEFGWRRNPGIYNALERRLVRRFERIYECNRDSLAYHTRLYPDIADRFHFFRNCVDTDFYRPLAPDERDAARARWTSSLGLAPSTRFVAFAGRLQPTKNVALLLDAWSRLRVVGAHLLIAGDGNLGPSLRGHASSLGIADQVSFLGAVEPVVVRELLQCSEVLAIPSTHEGLPMIALEALSCGTPVVTTDCGETPRLLSRSSGVVSKSAAPDEFAAALRCVLANRRQFRSRDCAAIASMYSAASVIGETYDELLDISPAASDFQRVVA